MENISESVKLRELLRIFERKLGILSDTQTSCCEVSIAQCHALVEIGRAKNIALNELAGLLSLDNSTMSRTVNNLVNNGLAKRDIDTQDRRYVTISLTESGIKVFCNIEANMTQYYKKVYDSIPENKRNQILDSLEILLKSLT